MAHEERQLITELGDQSMGGRSSRPVLAVACQPRRRSPAGDPARRCRCTESAEKCQARAPLSHITFSHGRQQMTWTTTAFVASGPTEYARIPSASTRPGMTR